MNSRLIKDKLHEILRGRNASHLFKFYSNRIDQAAVLIDADVIGQTQAQMRALARMEDVLREASEKPGSRTILEDIAITRDDETQQITANLATLRQDYQNALLQIGRLQGELQTARNRIRALEQVQNNAATRIANRLAAAYPGLVISPDFDTRVDVLIQKLSDEMAEKKDVEQQLLDCQNALARMNARRAAIYTMYIAKIASFNELKKKYMALLVKQKQSKRDIAQLQRDNAVHLRGLATLQQNFTNATNQIRALNAALATTQAANATAQATLAAAQAANATKTDIINTLTDEKKVLLADNADLTRERDDLSRANIDLQRMRAVLDTAFADLQRQKTQLEDDLRLSREATQARIDELLSVRRTLADEQKEGVRLQNVNDLLEQRTQDLTRELDEFRRQSRATCQDLQLEERKLQARVRDLEAENQQLQTQNTTHQQRIRELENSIATLESTAQVNASDLRSLHEQMKVRESDIQALEARLRSSQQDATIREAEKKDLQSNLDFVRTAYLDQTRVRAQLEQNLAECNANLDELREQLRVAEANVREKDAKITEHLAEIRSSQEVIQGLRNDLSREQKVNLDLQDELMRCRKMLNDKVDRATFEEVQSRLTLAGEQNADLTRQHNDLERRYADLTRQHADLTKRHADLTKRHADLEQSSRDEYAVAQRELAEVKQKLREARALKIMADLRALVVSRQMQRNQKQHEAEISRLQVELKDQKDRAEQLHRRVSDMAATNAELALRNNRLQQQNDELTRDNTRIAQELIALKASREDMPPPEESGVSAELVAHLDADLAQNLAQIREIDGYLNDITAHVADLKMASDDSDSDQNQDLDQNDAPTAVQKARKLAHDVRTLHRNYRRLEQKMASITRDTAEELEANRRYLVSEVEKAKAAERKASEALANIQLLQNELTRESSRVDVLNRTLTECEEKNSRLQREKSALVEESTRSKAQHVEENSRLMGQIQTLLEEKSQLTRRLRESSRENESQQEQFNTQFDEFRAEFIKGLNQVMVSYQTLLRSIDFGDVVVPKATASDLQTFAREVGDIQRNIRSVSDTFARRQTETSDRLQKLSRLVERFREVLDDGIPPERKIHRLNDGLAEFLAAGGVAILGGGGASSNSGSRVAWAYVISFVVVMLIIILLIYWLFIDPSEQNVDLPKTPYTKEPTRDKYGMPIK